MASTATLTSLAMLKVNIDQGKDYLEYLRPFILQVLVDHKPGRVTDQLIGEYLQTDFGLLIPNRTIQIILKRLARSNVLKRSEGIYIVTEHLIDPGIGTKKVDAERHIEAVISGLLDFDKEGPTILAGKDEAVASLIQFLSVFSVDSLRAYLRGTALPDVSGQSNNRIILVSQYVISLQRNYPERFNSFGLLVQGHMLANALMCPDLINAPRTYKNLDLYFDTPLLIHCLGVEGKLKEEAIKYLIQLLHDLGADVCSFSHSRNELERVLLGAAEYVDDPMGRGRIIAEARRNGTTKSDLLLIANQVDDMLSDAKIQIVETPDYKPEFQIDETIFGKVLDDEVSYFNPRAREYDVNSVRSIYALRAGSSPLNIEKCKAVLVTSNSAFAKAAYEYGKRYEESRKVSSVLTDYGVANIAWLKAPMGAPNLPITEVLAYCYAALQPTREFLEKFLSEIEKLEKNGRITSRDHQLLRSSVYAQDISMMLTLGEDAALTEERISETLARVTSEIKKEEEDKLKNEQEAHMQTQEELEAAKVEKEALQKRIYWSCMKRARRLAWAVSSLLTVLLASGASFGLGFRIQNPLWGWILAIGFSVTGILALFNLIFGTTVERLHLSIQDRFLTHLLKKESKITQVTLGVNG